MSEKNSIIKKENKNTPDVNILVDKKLEFFKDVIQKTIIHVQKNKILDILGISDISTCIDRLNEINKKIKDILNDTNTDSQINNLQIINNELSGIFKNYGTDSLDDLLLICFGNNYKLVIDENDHQKFELLKKSLGMDNAYDNNADSEEPCDSAEDAELALIKQRAGVPIIAVQEMADDEPLEG